MEDRAARYLADNIVNLRKKKNLSQEQLSEIAEIPRSTITHIESGSGNPSLQNLVKLSTALQVGIEELLSRPRNACELRALDQIACVKRSQGKVKIYKLLPDKLKGLEVDRLEMDVGARMGGQPHLVGAKEYLTVLQGEITVMVAGQNYVVNSGGMLAFPGDQAHAYLSTGEREALAISIVVPITFGID